MQKWLDNNDIFMNSTYDKGNAVVTERYIRTLKIKFYKNISANYNKSCPPYLNKIQDWCNNSYNCSVSKTSIDAEYSAMTEDESWNF